MTGVFLQEREYQGGRLGLYFDVHNEPRRRLPVTGDYSGMRRARRFFNWS
jgi:hypothetical protein